MEEDAVWWPSRASNPLGVYSVGFGEFDPHPFRFYWGAYYFTNTIYYIQ